ncbi:MAG TPA: aminopeptidase [Gemmatimonadales bacterium]|nr:aminopeptidase [Gemmatimonadales bacterium]
MTFVAIVVVLMAGYGTAWLASDEVRYLSRAGAEEFRILQRRRPIADLVGEAGLPPGRREALRLVLEVRDHAARLGLEAGDTYRQFSDVGRDTLLLVLSASPADCLCAHAWKYPIVGRVPYKGFFDPDQARRAARDFDARGYDTWLRPSGAFSTLGWFEDPLLSTALDDDPVELAATIFHEISHNTLYVRSATPFNESFAQLVGYRAAEAFFRERGDTARARRAADRWQDEVRLGAYYDSLGSRLERLYAAKPDSAALAAGRAEVAAWAREEVRGRVAPAMRTVRIEPSDRPVNNARIIAARIYRTRLDLFEAWFQREGADVRRAVPALRTLVEGAEGDAALARLEAALGGTTAGAP